MNVNMIIINFIHYYAQTVVIIVIITRNCRISMEESRKESLLARSLLQGVSHEGEESRILLRGVSSHNESLLARSLLL